MSNPTADAHSGILGRIGGLDRLLHAALVLLVVVSAVRYTSRHGMSAGSLEVLGGAVLLLVSYAALALSVGRRPFWRAQGWLVVAVVVWVVLALLAPSFAWCAVPLCFAALRVLPFTAACIVVGLLVLTVVVAWARISDGVDPTAVAGPVCVAVLAVGVFRALERDATLRVALLEELREAESDLAVTQHRAGALAERARLSHEIHDSAAQRLSSINLLLQAAQQEWDDGRRDARQHVIQAAFTARDGLDEVRRMVRGLAPTALDSDDTGAALPEALERACLEVLLRDGAHAQLRVHGEPTRIDPQIATALLRTARGALANVAEHAQARMAVVTLTYQEACVSLDVRDDGVGFNPADPPRTGRPGRGNGLAGIRDRVARHDGQLVVESAPGEGTAVAASFPLVGS
ncbi:MAG: sensor histidine kinase [Propionibacteriaceae bacterium]